MRLKDAILHECETIAAVLERSRRAGEDEREGEGEREVKLHLVLGRGIEGRVGEGGQIVESDGVVGGMEEKPNSHDTNKQKTNDTISVLGLPLKEQRVGSDIIGR